MRRHAVIAAAILAFGVGLVESAQAHALLRHAEPAVGSTVAGAPKELALTFSEAVEPAFCTRHGDRRRRRADGVCHVAG